MAVKLWVGLLVLLGLVVPRTAADDKRYFEIGRSLVLTPEFSEPINSITWKHKGNIVAEWFEKTLPLEYLGDLKGRTELDLTTGTLTVRNMTKPDDGLFTVEINNRVLPDRFDAVGVNRLDKFTVEVRVQPLACASTGSCTLVCDGKFEDVGHVDYFWKFGETGEWRKDESKTAIARDKNAEKTFICKAKNPISEKQSAPFANPFIKEADPSNTGVVVGVSIFLIALVAFVFFAILALVKPELMPESVQNIVRRFRPNPGGDSGAPTANGKDTEAHEAELMNKPTDSEQVSNPEDKTLDNGDPSPI